MPIRRNELGDSDPYSSWYSGLSANYGSPAASSLNDEWANRAYTTFGDSDESGHPLGQSVDKNVESEHPFSTPAADDPGTSNFQVSQGWSSDNQMDPTILQSSRQTPISSWELQKGWKYGGVQQSSFADPTIDAEQQQSSDDQVPDVDVLSHSAGTSRSAGLQARSGEAAGASSGAAGAAGGPVGEAVKQATATAQAATSGLQGMTNAKLQHDVALKDQQGKQRMNEFTSSMAANSRAPGWGGDSVNVQIAAALNQFVNTFYSNLQVAATAANQEIAERQMWQGLLSSGLGLVGSVAAAVWEAVVHDDDLLGQIKAVFPDIDMETYFGAGGRLNPMNLITAYTGTAPTSSESIEMSELPSGYGSEGEGFEENV